MMKATQPARRNVLKIMVAMSLSMESTGASERGGRGCFSCREWTGGGKGLLSSIPLSFTFCFRMSAENEHESVIVIDFLEMICMHDAIWI